VSVLRRLLLGVAALFVVAGCGGGGAERADTPTARRSSFALVTPAPGQGVEAILRRGDETLRICLLVADTPVERQRGLSGIDSLGSYDGALFVFEVADTHQFWMKNTRVPLDLAPIDGDGRILEVVRMQPCRDEPCELYTPGVPYERAVEFADGVLDPFPDSAGPNPVVVEVGTKPCG
jgi:uncharacterized membrane protein (UPF0127 family)